MKILYYYPELSNPMMQWQRVHFFDELAHYGIEFEVFNPLLCENIEQAQEEVIKISQNERFDLFMTCLCNEKHIYRSTIEDIKRRGIPTLSFRPDNLAIPLNDKKMSPVFDLIWLTSKDTQYLYDRWGANTVSLPYAANPFVYKYEVEPSIRRVCFIGNPHGSRVSIINNLTKGGVYVDMFHGSNKKMSDAEVGIEPQWVLPLSSPSHEIINRIRTKEGRRLLLGTLYEKISNPGTLAGNDYLNQYPGVPFGEMVEKYSRYYLSLSFSSYAKTDVLKRNLPVVNLRNFEIPMCGGIQLCRYSEEMASLFENGKEVVLYRDRDEMIEKAKYYLDSASDQEIREMKKSARIRSENEHTWMNRFKVVFDSLGLKYKSV